MVLVAFIVLYELEIVLIAFFSMLFSMTFVICKKDNMVGLGGLEPPTSRLSGVRSNHLSYKPIVNP